MKYDFDYIDEINLIALSNLVEQYPYSFYQFICRAIDEVLRDS